MQVIPYFGSGFQRQPPGGLVPGTTLLLRCVVLDDGGAPIAAAGGECLLTRPDGLGFALSIAATDATDSTWAAELVEFTLAGRWRVTWSFDGGAAGPVMIEVAPAAHPAPSPAAAPLVTTQDLAPILTQSGGALTATRVPNLPEATTLADALVVLSQDGVTKQASAALWATAVTDALPDASTSARGLMSAADKLALAATSAALDALAPVASSGAYADLTGRPTLGDVAATSAGTGLSIAAGVLALALTSGLVTDALGYTPLATAPVTTVAGRTGDVTLAVGDISGALSASTAASTYAPLASPALTGTPTAPTPLTADNSTKIATTAWVRAQGYLTSNAVTSVAGRTGAVTLAVGDVTDALSATTAASTYLPLAGGTLTGALLANSAGGGNVARVAGAATGSPVFLGVSSTSADANVSSVLGSPKGTGYISAQLPDSTAAGGNARGTYSTDWQRPRIAATQVASGSTATIGGGNRNTASGGGATVAGGDTGTASGNYSFIGGGESNTASGQDSVVSGGNGNVASGLTASIGGGQQNAAGSTGSTVAGGLQNSAGGVNAWVPGGSNATTRSIIGAGAWAAGAFATPGDAQTRELLARRQSTSATAVVLTTDNGTAATGNQLVLPNNSSFTVHLLVQAQQIPNGAWAASTAYLVGNLVTNGGSRYRCIAAGTSAASGGPTGTGGAITDNGVTWTYVSAPEGASWKMVARIARGATAASAAFRGGWYVSSALVNTALTAGTGVTGSIADASASGWTVALNADTTNGALNLTCVGEANKSILWDSRLQSLELVG